MVLCACIPADHRPGPAFRYLAMLALQRPEEVQLRDVFSSAGRAYKSRITTNPKPRVHKLHVGAIGYKT